MSKQFELLKKLQALSKGTDNKHEAALAEQRLKELMAKFGYTEDDLESEKLEWFSIETYHLLDEWLLHQIIHVVKSKPDFTEKNGYFVVKLTHAEYVEVESYFDFYRKPFFDAFRTFKDAFCIKNDLCCKSNENEAPPSKEEIKAWKKANNMARSIEKNRCRKQLKKAA